jgi:hypothetical protein
MSSTEPPSSPRRRPVLRFLARRLEGWRLRHRLPFNFWVHMIGIPMVLTGIVLLFVLPWGEWYWGAGAFVLGYLLQWIGHQAEGNDVGEWAAIKRLLGLPYVGISPRWGPEDPTRL